MLNIMQRAAERSLEMSEHVEGRLWLLYGAKSGREIFGKQLNTLGDGCVRCVVTEMGVIVRERVVGRWEDVRCWDVGLVGWVACNRVVAGHGTGASSLGDGEDFPEFGSAAQRQLNDEYRGALSLAASDEGHSDAEWRAHLKHVQSAIRAGPWLLSLVARANMLLLVLGWLVVAVAPMDNLRVAFEWKSIDFDYPSEEVRREAVDAGDFIPENNLPLGLEVHADRVFVTVPRWKSGVPASLAYIHLNGNYHTSLVLLPESPNVPCALTSSTIPRHVFLCLQFPYKYSLW